MPIDPRLLEILVCPACHGAVAPLADESGMACAGCGRVYPVRGGIVSMLVEEATAPSKPEPER